jgi:hypothetical protein
VTEDAISIGGVDLADPDTYAGNALRCVPEAPRVRTRGMAPV